MTEQNTASEDTGALYPFVPAGLDSPDAVFDYLQEQLEALQQLETPQAKSICEVIAAMLEEFENAPSNEAGFETLKMRLARFEIGLMLMHLETARQVRNELTAESRKLGTKSDEAKFVRSIAEALDLMVNGVEKALTAAQAGDESKREEARRMLAEAQTLMSKAESQGVPGSSSRS